MIENYRKTRKTHSRGTRALQPLAAEVLDGTLYFVTDEGVIEQSNGLIWVNYSSSTIPPGVFTQGSVIFAGPSGVLAQDNANLFWDDTNNRLGIGTNVPAYPVEISANVSQVLSLLRSTASAINQDVRLTFRNLDSAQVPRDIGYIIAAMSVNTAGAIDSYMGFQTRAAGVLSEKVRIDKTGNVSIGAAGVAATALLDVRGSAVFNENGDDRDFRIEGDTDQNLLFIDASTDNVGIGTSLPPNKFCITSPGNTSFEVNIGSGVTFQSFNRNTSVYTSMNIDGTLIRFRPSGSEKFFLDATNAVFNDSAADFDVRMEGQTEPNLFFLDANVNRIGFGVGAPTAIIHIKAGTTAANTAPLKFTSGPLNTTPVAGQYEYNGNHYLTNVAPIRFPVGGTLFDHFADVSVGGAEADIYSDTLVANTLNSNGDKVAANYGGNFVTVGTELTQLKVYFAGTVIWDSTGVAPTSGTTSWRVFVEIIRVSSSVVRYMISLNTTGASGFVYCNVGELTGLTLSGTNILKITGTSSGVGSGAGDIVGKMSSVEFKPAA